MTRAEIDPPPAAEALAQTVGLKSTVPLGIAMMLGFCIVIPWADAGAKLIGDGLPLGQLVLLRFLAQAALLAPLVWAMGGTLRLPLRVWRIVSLRAALQSLGIGLMALSLRWLPLADAVAIAFVMPFILLGLGYLFAGEEVGPHRIAACTVGFLGTLLVVQPNFAAVGAPALIPLVVAFIFSCFMLSTRAIAQQVDPIAVQAATGIVATAVLIPLLLIGSVAELSELRLIRPGGDLWGPILLTMLAGTLAHLLMTWSLRFAPSATLAPMQYLEIPLAAIVGWTVFGDLPNGLALAGIAVTVGAGLYVIHRERVAARRPPEPAAPTI